MHLPEESKDFENCPPGNHPAVCCQLIDLGTHRISYKGAPGKPQRRIRIAWEISAERTTEGKPFIVFKTYTLSSFDRARLRKDLESWRGKPFKDEDLGPGGYFKLESVIGAPCLLNIVASEVNGRKYSNVETVARLPKGLSAPMLESQKVFFSLDPAEYNAATFDSLTESTKETIRHSPEFEQIAKGNRQTPELEDRPAEPDGFDIPF